METSLVVLDANVWDKPRSENYRAICEGLNLILSVVK